MAHLKIIFCGTPDYAVPTLRALIEQGYEVCAVYTQPDRPAGRGRRLTASAVKKTALEYGLPVLQPTTLRDQEVVKTLKGFAADLMVVAAYGLLLPQAALRAPALGCINVHASLLPRWRGAAPIQRCILCGDQESGVTIMGMEAGLDTGPIYLKRRISVDDRESGGSLHDKLAALGASTLVEALPGIVDGTLQAEPQDEAQATYAKKLSKRESMVDWTRPAVEVDRMVRAFNPWPVAQTSLGKQTLRLWSSELIHSGQTGEQPGRVVDAGTRGIDIATGLGLLRVNRLQLSGKRPMTAMELLSGRLRLVGEVLG